MPGRTLDVPGGFLNLPQKHRSAHGARVHVLPVPYEETVSYETGTGDGPAALILASQQVEHYDPDFGGEPALAYGIHTLRHAGPRFKDAEAMMRTLADAAEKAVRAGKLLFSVGGEHSITPGLLRGVIRASEGPVTVVQIDAHADLRDSYEGSRYSHACAMRRCLDENAAAVIGLGIRSFCLEEALFIKENSRRVSTWTADGIESADPAELSRALGAAVHGRRIYLTIDVDGLDPSVIPATGTPEPGGLSWRQALAIVKTVGSAAEVVAVDCVELAPRRGLHMAEYAAAKLMYKTLSYALKVG
jgi:agmatinase